MTGVRENCVFHALDFHVCENRCVDIMHDLLEGIVKYDVAAVLLVYIRIKKYFSLTELNDRMNGFNYDVNDKRDKPSEISLHHLTQKTLHMSSSETYCFLRILPLLIGHLVPQNDEHWSLIILLKNVVEIAHSKRSTYRQFATLIEEYLTLLSSLFPDDFKPKHHNLIHYPNILKSMGPYLKFHLCGLRASIRMENKLLNCH